MNLRKIVASVENRIAAHRYALRIEIPYPLVDETDAELVAHVEVELDAEGNDVIDVWAEDMNGDPVGMTVPEFKRFAEQRDPGLKDLFQMAQDAMRDQEETARQAADVYRDSDRKHTCPDCGAVIREGEACRCKRQRGQQG
jgi:hypothetical protein